MKTRLSRLVGFLLEGVSGHDRARLAVRRSLVISAFLASLAALPACLSPQDIELEETPVKPHVPPTFDVTKDVSPNEPEVCVSNVSSDGVTAQPTEFRISNIKDTSGITLHARWFVDYEGGFVAIQRSDDLTEVEPGSGVFQAATFSSKDIDSLHQNGQPFFLDVVISDGFADNGTEPRNRAIATGAYAVNYRWSVVFKSGAPCE